MVEKGEKGKNVDLRWEKCEKEKHIEAQMVEKGGIEKNVEM